MEQQQQSTMATPPPVHTKGPWTMEEDRVLVNHVAAHGAGSWNYLARAAGLNRTGKSCRLRWLNYLRPGLRRGKMTAEEQELIVNLQWQWGNKWSKIARHLPGRTDNEVKNFWRTKVQKKRQHVIAAAYSWSSRNGDDRARATTTTTEGGGQGSSSGGSNSGRTVVNDDDVVTLTRDYGIVARQPSMCSVGVEDHLALALAAAGDTSTNTSTPAAAMDLVPELLAASGEDFWAIDNFWSTMLSRLGKNTTA